MGYATKDLGWGNVTFEERPFSSGQIITHLTSYNWKFKSPVILLAVWFGVVEKWKLSTATLLEIT